MISENHDIFNSNNVSWHLIEAICVQIMSIYVIHAMGMEPSLRMRTAKVQARLRGSAQSRLNLRCSLT